MPLLEPTNSILKSILDRLITEYQPQRIILFGSYAWGEPDQDSDIDLLIVKNTSDRFMDRWKKVRKILTDPKRKVGLDTLILSPDEINQRLGVGDQFIQEIIESGVELYAA